MLISFVIPVYNVQSYLKDCVLSITSQTYQDIEVILVDDGSKDNSPAICDKLASNDKRVRVIHKDNGGLSDARNCGLKAVHGEYVVFLDSDDFWIGRDSLQKLVKIIADNKDIDFINFNCCYYYGDENFTKWVAFDNSLSKPTDSDFVIQKLVASGTFPMSACLKVISTKLLRQNELYFKVGLLSEDIPWFIDLLDCSSKSLFINEYIYAYRQNVGTSISRNFGEKNFDSLMSIIKNELDKLETRRFTLETKNYIKSFLAYEFCICLANINRLGKEEKNEKYKELLRYKWLLKYKQNPKVRNVSMAYSVLGIKAVEYLLRFYINRKYKN